MIKQATVVSQKRSSIKPNLFITTLKDDAGEIKAYTSRKLEEGSEVTVSVQQGALRDPLSVEILTPKQASQVHKSVPLTSETAVEYELTPELVENLVKDALSEITSSMDYLSTDKYCFWFKDNENRSVTDIAKLIHRAARDRGYLVSGTTSPLISSLDESKRIRLQLEPILDELGSRVVVSQFWEA